MSDKKGYIYILTNPGKTVLYIGVISNLAQKDKPTPVENIGLIYKEV